VGQRWGGARPRARARPPRLDRARQDTAAQKIRLGKALSSARDRHFAHYRIVAGRNSNAKTAQYRLIDVEAGEDENAPPAEQLSLDAAGGQA
jgi:hypothetical protein